MAVEKYELEELKEELRDGFDGIVKALEDWDGALRRIAELREEATRAQQKVLDKIEEDLEDWLDLQVREAIGETYFPDSWDPAKEKKAKS